MPAFVRDFIYLFSKRAKCERDVIARMIRRLKLLRGFCFVRSAFDFVLVVEFFDRIATFMVAELVVSIECDFSLWCG